MSLATPKKKNVFGRIGAFLITIAQYTYMYTMEVATLHHLGVVALWMRWIIYFRDVPCWHHEQGTTLSLQPWHQVKILEISNLLGDDRMRGCALLVPLRPTRKVDVYSDDVKFGSGEEALLHDFFGAAPFTPHGDTLRGAWKFYKAKDADISFRG